MKSADEIWAANALIDKLDGEKAGWICITGDDQEAPDLILENASKRVACELTGVGLNELHRWARDPRQQLDLGQLDSIVVPREPHAWAEEALKRKSAKFADYLRNSSSDEAWLVIHGEGAFDVFKLDNEYDLPLLAKACLDIEHPFERVFVASPSERKVVQISPNEELLKLPRPRLNKRTLLSVQIKSTAVQLGRGVTTANLGDFPDRTVVLKPLKRYPEPIGSSFRSSCSAIAIASALAH